MEPIRAKYAGTCARTGKPYRAGDLIVKLSSGKWAIAQDKAGNTKVAPPAPAVSDIRLLRKPNGNTASTDISRPVYCGACVKGDGFDPKSLPSNFDLSPYVMVRQADQFLHERCGYVLEIVPRAEEADIAHQALMAHLHLEATNTGYGCPGLQLSHKVGPELWAKVKQWFSYMSSDDLDEMDYFNMEGGWFCHPSNAEKIEEALEILPQNRLAVLTVKKAEAEAAYKLRQAEKAAFEVRLRDAFDIKEGEYVWGEEVEREIAYQSKIGDKWVSEMRKCKERSTVRVQGETVKIGEGQNIYGGGEWLIVDADGKHVWHVRNNGHDGDDWSRNNIGTGGAGGIGHRFVRNPERDDIIQHLRELQSQKGN